MTTNQRSQHGIDAPVFAYGVVELRDSDPLRLGRCKVRYFYHHPESKEEVPTEDLPWSYVLMDIDSGKNCIGPREGDWVFAIFRDGILAQQPLILGILTGIPERPANPAIGFYDQKEYHPLDPFPPEQHDDGSGTDWHNRDLHVTYPDERFLKEPLIDRLARVEKISETIVEQKRGNRHIGQIDIPTADHPPGTGSDVASPGDDFSEPEIPYNAKYPYNHVYASEAGHITELDDTPEAERLHRYHRLGTFEEIHPDGSRVTKVVNDEFLIVLKRRFSHIEAAERHTVDWFKKDYINKDGEAGFNYDLTIGPGGNFNITTEEGKLNINLNGDWNIYVNGNATIEVEEDLIATVHKNAHVQIDANLYANVDGTADIRVAGNTTAEIGGDLRETVQGDVIGYVGGNKIQHIKGNYKLVVGGNIEEIAGGDILRASAKTISDVAVETCLRGAIEAISDTAPVIYHNAAVTNCTAALFGYTLDSDGDETPPGPAGPFPDLPPAQVPIAQKKAERAVEAELKEVPTPMEAIQEALETIFAELELAAEFHQSQVDQNPNAPASASAGGGGGGGGGPKGPSVYVDGPGGFLWKPTGENSGVATILVPGKPGVAIYQAVQSGEETVEVNQSNPDGTTTTTYEIKPKYKKGAKIEEARYIKAYHGDGRAIYRLSKPGSAYPGPIICDAGKEVFIAEPGTRHD